MTTMREALERAMGRTPDNQMVRQLEEGGLAVVDVDSMSQAIHDVYWGSWPTIRIRTRRTKTGARSMIAALQKVSA